MARKSTQKNDEKSDKKAVRSKILDQILANQSPNAFTMGPVYSAIENSPIHALVDFPVAGVGYIEAIEHFVPDLAEYSLRYGHAAMNVLLQNGNILASARPDRPHNPLCVIPTSAWAYLQIVPTGLVQFVAQNKFGAIYYDLNFYPAALLPERFKSQLDVKPGKLPTLQETTKKARILETYAALKENRISNIKLNSSMKALEVSDIISKILDVDAKYINDLISSSWQIDKGNL